MQSKITLAVALRGSAAPKAAAPAPAPLSDAASLDLVWAAVPAAQKSVRAGQRYVVVEGAMRTLAEHADLLAAKAKEEAAKAIPDPNPDQADPRLKDKQTEEAHYAQLELGKKPAVVVLNKKGTDGKIYQAKSVSTEDLEKNASEYALAQWCESMGDAQKLARVLEDGREDKTPQPDTWPADKSPQALDSKEIKALPTGTEKVDDLRRADVTASLEEQEELERQQRELANARKLQELRNLKRVTPEELGGGSGEVIDSLRSFDEKHPNPDKRPIYSWIFTWNDPDRIATQGEPSDSREGAQVALDHFIRTGLINKRDGSTYRLESLPKVTTAGIKVESALYEVVHKMESGKDHVWKGNADDEKHAENMAYDAAFDQPEGGRDKVQEFVSVKEIRAARFVAGPSWYEDVRKANPSLSQLNRGQVGRQAERVLNRFQDAVNAVGWREHPEMKGEPVQTDRRWYEDHRAQVAKELLKRVKPGVDPAVYLVLEDENAHFLNELLETLGLFGSPAAQEAASAEAKFGESQDLEVKSARMQASEGSHWTVYFAQEEGREQDFLKDLGSFLSAEHAKRDPDTVVDSMDQSMESLMTEWASSKGLKVEFPSPSTAAFYPKSLAKMPKLPEIVGKDAVQASQAPVLLMSDAVGTVLALMDEGFERPDADEAEGWLEAAAPHVAEVSAFSGLESASIAAGLRAAVSPRLRYAIRHVLASVAKTFDVPGQPGVKSLDPMTAEEAKEQMRRVGEAAMADVTERDEIEDDRLNRILRTRASEQDGSLKAKALAWPQAADELAAARAWQNSAIDYMGGGYHPDDPADDYINLETQEATFTPEEAAQFDTHRRRAHAAFEAAGKDIYEDGLRHPIFKGDLLGARKEACDDCGAAIDPEKGEAFPTDEGGLFCADCYPEHEKGGEGVIEELSPADRVRLDKEEADREARKAKMRDEARAQRAGAKKQPSSKKG